MENAKLMKTLFYNGRFNADGKRMRAVIDREVSNGQDRYRLWRKCGVPDHAYPQAENDTHLLYLELHGYLASLGMTEYSLIYESGRLLAIAELYGDMDGREKHMNELRKSEQAYTVEIPKALKIEGETIQRLGREPAHQADCIKKKMDEHISTYLEARENGGQTFPDFIGAAALDELALCRELSAKYRAKCLVEDAARQAEVEEEHRKIREETNRKADEQIQKAVHVLKHGGVLENEMIHLYRADGGYGSYAIVNHLMRLYGVDVPLRTQGWINEKLVSLHVLRGCCNDLRYRAKKGDRCSDKIFDCVNELIKKARSEREAAA